MLVIHGTYDAPPLPHQESLSRPSSSHSHSRPAPSSPPPPPRAPWYWLDRQASREVVETNFCGVIRKHLRDSPMGTEAVWRDLPGDAAAVLHCDAPVMPLWGGVSAPPGLHAPKQPSALLIASWAIQTRHPPSLRIRQ